MQLKFYTMLSDKNDVQKTLSNELIVEGSIREDAGLSLKNPQILVDSRTKTLFGHNYVYIPELQRYYYIDNFTIERTGIVSIQLSCDVLMSFWDEFKYNNAIIERNEEKYNLYLQDGKLDVEQGTNIRRYKTTGPFVSTTPAYILVGANCYEGTVPSISNS